MQKPVSFSVSVHHIDAKTTGVSCFTGNEIII